MPASGSSAEIAGRRRDADDLIGSESDGYHARELHA
jgi:hypothetical protein